MAKVPMTARRLRLACIYLEPEIQARLVLVTSDLGWPQKNTVQQFIHAHMKRYHPYWVRAALADAAARGMDEETYYRALRDGEPELERYRGSRPAFETSPVAKIPEVSVSEKNRIDYNWVTLSPCSYTLLKVAHIVEGGPMTQLVSRFVVKHFQDYWEAVYLPQIGLNRQCRFRPNKSPDQAD